VAVTRLFSGYAFLPFMAFVVAWPHTGTRQMRDMPIAFLTQWFSILILHWNLYNKRFSKIETYLESAYTLKKIF
jgi:hypothetical protein